MYIHMYIHTYTHTNTYMHTYIHTYIHTYLHTYIHTYIHTYTHVHTYIHTHTYTHTYTYFHLIKYTNRILPSRYKDSLVTLHNLVCWWHHLILQANKFLMFFSILYHSRVQSFNVPCASAAFVCHDPTARQFWLFFYNDDLSSFMQQCYKL